MRARGGSLTDLLGIIVNGWLSSWEDRISEFNIVAFGIGLLVLNIITVDHFVPNKCVYR